MSSTKSSGRSSRSSMLEEGRSSGARSSTTSGAVSSSPSTRTTPVDPARRDRDHAGDGRLGADLGTERARRRGHRRGEPAHAPSGKPHEPSSPSPTSPILWWAMTNAVPGDRGPAHVPITPDTDSTPRSCGRLEVVLEEVGDAHGEQPGHVGDAPDAEARCSCHTSRAWSRASPGARLPSFGGIAVSSGPSTSASPWSHSSHGSYGVGVRGARTWRSRPGVAPDRRAAAASDHRGRARSRDPAGRPCSRGARAGGRAGWSAAAGSPRRRAS